jgi:hypothetical protein
MGKKKAVKKSTAKKKAGGAQFSTKIYRNVLNDEVLDLIAEILQKPKYVTHKIVPQGGGKSTIVVILRK